MIYHVVPEAEWNAQLNDKTFAPSAYPREGFIHASHHHQVDGVVQRYYANRSDLLLLHIEEQKLTCQLKEEQSTNKEWFPHIFGKINKDAIVKVTKYPQRPVV